MEARKAEGTGCGSCGGFLYREGFRPKVSSHAAGQGQGSWNGLAPDLSERSWSQGDVM